jgi:predicted amidohydrolase
MSSTASQPPAASSSGSQTQLTCAAIQINSRSDVAANLATCARLATQAHAAGARMIAFPENFSYMGDSAAKIAMAEEVSDQASGRILSTMRELAARLGAYLLLGGMPEKSPDPERAYNTFAVLGPDGRLAARYRKIHLFDIDIAGGPKHQESATVARGEEPVCVDTPWGKLGLSICYDLRFPELYRKLAEQGARVMFVPAAFTMHTGKDHWTVLLRARAIENLCYIVAPAQWGQNTEYRATYGKSLICDPWGLVIAQASDTDGFALASLDLSYADALRAQLPALSHRRM